jgi:hypothetical protein
MSTLGKIGPDVREELERYSALFCTGPFRNIPGEEQIFEEPIVRDDIVEIRYSGGYAGYYFGSVTNTKKMDEIKDGLLGKGFNRLSYVLSDDGTAIMIGFSAFGSGGRK